MTRPKSKTVKKKPATKKKPAPKKKPVAKKSPPKPIAKPDKIFFTAELPKTRSAKIMRRLLRDVAEGRALGDTTTLTDPTVLADLKKRYEEREG